MTVRPTKTQISLGISPVWSESSLCAQWVVKDPGFLHADSEVSDQTGRTTTLLVLSCRGSFMSSLIHCLQNCVVIFNIVINSCLGRGENGLSCFFVTFIYHHLFSHSVGSTVRLWFMLVALSAHLIHHFIMFWLPNETFIRISSCCYNVCIVSGLL